MDNQNTEGLFDFQSTLCNSMSMKRTYQPKKRKRARTHGYLKRSKTPAGKRVLKARRRKGRAALSA